MLEVAGLPVLSVRRVKRDRQYCRVWVSKSDLLRWLREHHSSDELDAAETEILEAVLKRFRREGKLEILNKEYVKDLLARWRNKKLSDEAARDVTRNLHNFFFGGRPLGENKWISVRGEILRSLKTYCQ
jgi:hypothetical protein